MSIMMYMLRQMKASPFRPRHITDIVLRASSSAENTGERPLSPRMEEFKKKLRETAPVGEMDLVKPNYPEEKEPLEPWPNDINPHTGEVGGPRGPEPTRYGDWERKGRVIDF